MNFPVDTAEETGYIAALGKDSVYFVFRPDLQTVNAVRFRVRYHQSERGVFDRCPVVLAPSAGYPFLEIEDFGLLIWRSNEIWFD